MKPWKTLSSKHVLQDQFLSLRTDRCEREDGHIVPTYHVLEMTDWVTVIPITKAGEVVLVKEYRHAAKIMLYGLPGGMMDEGETDRKAAMARELREETGYTAPVLHHIGSCYPNPAVQDNIVHLYFAPGVEPTAIQDLDPNEEIEVVTLPWAEFAAYEKLEYQHAIHAAALFYAERYFQKHPDQRP